MNATEKIGHEGVVQSATLQSIVVQITQHSACAGCHAKSACGMSETTQKVVELHRDGSRFSPGEPVIVYAAKGSAFYSVFFAYILPSLLLAGSIWGAGMAGAGEVPAALVSLTVLTLYYVVLYLNRKNMGKKIHFTIEKQNTHSNSL